MTTFTRDPDVIAAEWARLTGQDRDWARILAKRPRMYALTDPAAMLLFDGASDGMCDAMMRADFDATGAQRKAAINRGFRWAFSNTPIYVMRGHVNKDNVAMIAMASQIDGIFVADQDADTYTYKITLASLVKAYGIQAVVDALNAGNQQAKAAKLQAAYDAWVGV